MVNIKFNKTVLIFGAIALTFLVLLFSFYLFVYNPRFYDHQYSKNGVYAEFGYDETWNATKELWDYMHFRTDELSDFYSTQDKYHMIDVRNIIHSLETILYIVSVVFIISLIYFYSFNRKEFPFWMYALFLSAGSLLFLLLVFFAILSLWFTQSFTIFHKFLFTNNYWLMDPAVDSLIRLYPEQFFSSIFLSILGVSLLFAFILLGLSFYVKKRYL
ncbi:MAG: TIGR01906 family membrane protein [Candidatus Woesearchaeota archaeon]|jgi:integral membrane protein (TIGR01906 family)